MLKLKRFDKPEWFEMPEYDGVKLLIRPVPFQSITGFLSAAKRKVTAGDKVVDDYDDGAFGIKVFKYALVDFEGIEIEGEDDKPLSKDKQKEVMYNYEVFRTFVGEKAKELEQKISGELKSETKNLETSQGG